jgi:hypothetical protein
MLHSAIKVIAFVFGLFVFLGGLVAVSAGGESAVSGLTAVAFGAAIMVAALWQRGRYRSNNAAGNQPPPGPGGGETGFIDPRFAPTGEVFTDPTTRHVMRVYVDPRTGERRYLAEGRF